MSNPQRVNYQIGQVIAGLTIISIEDKSTYRIKHTHKADENQEREPCNEESTMTYGSLGRRVKRNYGATCIKCRNRRPNRITTRDVGDVEADRLRMAEAFKNIDKFAPLTLPDHHPREAMPFIWCDKAALRLPGRIE